MVHFYKVLLVAVLFYATERFCHRQTGGFTVSKIIPRHQASGEDPEDPTALSQVLSQPFHYLGQGGQCYVFESEDQTVVIKFFKQHHMNYLRLLEKLPGTENFLQKYEYQSQSYFLNSCRLAYERFKERAGLIYLHTHRTTSLTQKFLIFDKLGIKHEIDLNQIDFALQKKAVLSRKQLKKLIREGDLDKAKRCIDSIVSLIVERGSIGLRDRDPNFRTNIGFLGETAIEIDIGSFESDELSDYREEAAGQVRKLKKWLSRRNQELANYLNEKEALWQN